MGIRVDMVLAMTVTMYLTVIATLFFVDIEAVFDPPFLLPVLNTLFLSCIPFFAAYTTMRLFLAIGQLPLLLFGSGMLALGSAGLVSGWFIGDPGGPNIAVTIYDSGALLSGLLLAGAKLLRCAAPTREPIRHRGRCLTAAYLGVFALISGVVFCAGIELTPLFIRQGIGPTVTGRAVLGGAIVLFGVSAWLSVKQYADSGRVLFCWYAAGLGLIASGLAAVFLQKAVGSPLGWAGRAAQYTGGLCILAGLLTFWRGIRLAKISFAAAAEVIYHEAKANYKALIEAAPDGIVCIDQNERILLWNRAAEHLFGYSETEAIQARLRDLILPDGDREGPHPVFDCYAETSCTGPLKSMVLETEVRKRGGAVFPAEFSLSRRISVAGPVTTFIIKDITWRRKIDEELLRHERHLDELVRDRTLELNRTNERLVQEIAERTRMEETLRRSEAGLNKAQQYARVGSWTWDVKTDRLEWSDEMFRIFGLDKASFTGSLPDVIARAIHPDDRLKVEESNRSVANERKGEPLEYRVVWPDQSIHTVWAEAGELQVDEEGNSSLLSGYVQDITESKQAEERISRALKEKEVLLKEVHHRVKNNLQVICSLLSLQANGSDDQRVRAQFEESRNQVFSMALIHEKLYKSADLSHVNFQEYLQNLVDSIAESYKRRDIVTAVDMTPVSLDVNAGILCGLIVNELISNSFKYAFPEGRRGTIRVGVIADSDEGHVLSVADDGIGFPAHLDFRKTTSLGLQLVNGLTSQLRGALALSTEGGTRFSITFKSTPESGGERNG